MLIGEHFGARLAEEALEDGRKPLGNMVVVAQTQLPQAVQRGVEHLVEGVERGGEERGWRGSWWKEWKRWRRGVVEGVEGVKKGGGRVGIFWNFFGSVEFLEGFWEVFGRFFEGF